MAWLRQSRGSPRLVLVVVCVALLLDNMLLTVVVPIIPTFLYAMEHPSPEPQTTQPSLLPLPSRSAPIPGTPSARSPRSSPLLSLFDNSTFSLHSEIRTEPTPPNAEPTTDLQLNETTDASGASCLQDSAFLGEENVRVGLLFASKALVQLLINPFVGPLTNR
ncbi:chromaffin granule amine transporter-like [Anarrhichthys ocellatus]|uniref:chromaffin granule amine transporter-like n=1 Tax=Anarrhichthys ocellatus TaxID=433405 RepID=UPI0012EE1944|nr:chromaffin granule amine transporter-like [Anarrhichthys ocellatus]XP_031735776.1 chromaffin granule amine transporter-like [Anarrhichthys ocellatus]XP_031735778.1 chromaffin granule amine transporter-like [Anarrhichthys ocellatus]XP_031735779.1 chromaffin granule amine transporter-like [Anarrhichthys ocellatus]